MNSSSLKSAATTLCWVVLATGLGGRRCCCRAGWIDPDTPDAFRTTTSNFDEDTREFELVSEYFSMQFVSMYFPLFIHMYFLR